MTMTVDNHIFSETIQHLQQEGLKRELRCVEGPQDVRIKIDGQMVLNFCSNNYLGLASDSRLSEAAAESFKDEGFGAGASRLICGNMRAHRRLEKTIADFKGAEDCLMFSSGYMANIGIISSIFNRDDVIFADRLNHASIIDGIKLSQAKLKRYPHCHMGRLEDMLKSTRVVGKKVIITDSVFSMDGDIAPLDNIVHLAKKYQCLIMIDEAHSFGVIGKNGKGLAEHFNVEDKIDIQMGTLSKAAGSFGAYCCGDKKLIEYLINKARSFIYTTGLPPSIAAASIRAVEIIKNEPQLREKLWDNTHFVRTELKGLGFDPMQSQTPIIPILIKDAALTTEFSNRLFDEKIMISAIRPPTVPQRTARLRIAVTAAHRREDLEILLDKLKKTGKALCLI